MYKLKNVAKRGSALFGAASLLVGIGTSAMPGLASADALNPLTERSLTLSSSSPGWSYLDGSGNITYAPPHSGANGQKTGETFKFRMSSHSTTGNTKTIKAMTFQFCTTPAGTCVSPGNNTTDASDDHGGSGVVTTATGTGTLDFSDGDDTVTGNTTTFTTQLNVGAKIVTAGGNVYTVASIDSPTSLTVTENATDDDADDGAFTYREADTSSTSDLNVAVATSGPTVPAEITSGADWATVTSADSKTPPANDDNSDYIGNFVVLHRNGNLAEPTDWGDFTHSSADDWDMSVGNDETGDLTTADATGANNMITISSATGEDLTTDVGDYFEVIFFGTDDNYITNPGKGAFFVRMNTYDDDSSLDSDHLVDGGVTVANVMNESISIQTKVLETMDFSVGTFDPDLYTDTTLTGIGHGTQKQCATLLMADPNDPTVTAAVGTPAKTSAYNDLSHNVLHLGNSDAEFSLRTDQAYDVQSYWRLSSNSSGGATVYYTGHTLTNTEGDEIAPLDESGNTGTGTYSSTGTEQFGLAIDHGTSTLPIGPGLTNVESYPVDESGATPYGDSDAASGDGDFATYLADNLALGKGDEFAHLPRLYPLVPQNPYASGNGSIAVDGAGAKFAFNAHADSFAIPIASESTQVVNCVTAKMRYMANIAATTPAGIYTTKINYVASPQY